MPADDSGSMAFEEGGERIEDLKLILGKVAEIATLFDQVGGVRAPGGGGGGRRGAVSSCGLHQQQCGTLIPPAPVCCRPQDGILVRFMNSDVQGNGIRSAQDAAACLQQVKFGGVTPLAASMERKVGRWPGEEGEGGDVGGRVVRVVP